MAQKLKSMAELLQPVGIRFGVSIHESLQLARLNQVLQNYLNKQDSALVNQCSLVHTEKQQATILCINSATATRLRFHSARLLTEFCAQKDLDPINQLRIRVNAQSGKKLISPHKKARSSANLSNKSRQHLSNYAAALENGPLKRAFFKLIG